MKKTDINKVEKALNIKLPKYYIDTLVKHNEALESIDANLFFFNDAQILIAENELMREPAFSGIDWDNNILVIGNNFCGKYYCIDVTSIKQIVFSYERETKKLMHYKNSISEWCDELLNNHEYEQKEFENELRNQDVLLENDIIDE